MFGCPSKRQCVVSVLENTCVERITWEGGRESKLLIGYQKPYKHVSKDTLARWLRDVLNKADVDMQQFGAHSTRTASTSAAITCGVPVDVLRAAGWRSGSTFT